MRAPSEADVLPEGAAAPRPPVRAVTVLMPVWGYRFVSQFLEFSLPTLLAPGNLPAVAAALPTRFVLLTSESEELLIRASPAWHRLEQTCTAEIRRIDDLITDGNHSATITLAFARAVRQTGEAMLDTAFIFLVSDYLVADGSLRSVVERIRGGASGVVAGNFQIIAEDAIPLLRRRIDPNSTVVALSPRELVRWSLAHLHPATVANMVNFGLSHNAHTNRLFWRVDENTLIGRFYLMHMIGIRPEVTDFVVGASCDYSFIPEMCPSGNVVALTDSDDYLVVEMQPRSHESKWLLPGPIEAKPLANSLSEWTTEQHRGNAANTLVYHAGEPPLFLAAAVAEADAFVAEVRGLLSPEPHPFRHHHYWIGSLASNRAQTRRPLSREDWQFLLGERAPRGLAATLWRLRAKFFGSAPDVTRLHPRWPDYGLPLNALKKIIAQNGRTLLVAPQPAAFARWLTRTAGDIFTLEVARLPELPEEEERALAGSFNACLMILGEGMLKSADEFIAHAAPLLVPGGQFMILVANERGFADAATFGREFAQQSARLLDTSTWVTDIHYVPASRLRWASYRALGNVLKRGDAAGWSSPLRLAGLALLTVPLTVATLLTNLGIRAVTTPPRGLWSSVFLILRPSGNERTPPRRSPSAARVRGAGKSINLPFAPALTLGARPRDPTLLAQSLARYRFIVDLLDSRRAVAEYGCVEALGSALVHRKVKKLTVYDPDSARLGELHPQSGEGTPVLAQVHDVLGDPLPMRHDAIYCLGAIEQITRDDEDVFARHLAASLSFAHGLLILGSASPDADDDGDGAAPPIGRRSAAELKALLERYFHMVLCFSMVDEIVHPGIVRAADYAFVVGCGCKEPL
ncbi:MAG TPA: hypothetical protein VGG01_01705 [Xanthobacteraceae bacterium]